MFLSVIIPTRNRSPLIKKVLFSLMNQTLTKDQFEVIVIDNGSTDDTAEICDEYKSKLPGFQRIYDECPGLHVGRHLGIKHAKGDILVYADDDIEAFPTWLAGVAESFRDPEVTLVGGKCLPKFESNPQEWVEYLWVRNQYGKTLGYYSLVDFGDEMKEISPFFVFGCNYSIRKNVLIEVGGFHPDAMPQELIKYRGDGESYVSRRIEELRYNVIYNPKASVYHWVPKSRLTLEYLKKRSFNQGISNSFAEIRNNHSSSDNYFNKHSSQSIYLKIREKSPKEILNAIKRRLNFSIHQSSGMKSRLKHDNSNYIKEQMKKACKEGYKYHQNEVKNDPELLKWVLKDNYLDI